MQFKIISGKYETGTLSQQNSYCELFGEEEIQSKFDLYFHWYNIVHELGHCLLAEHHINMDQVQEELYVNRFAVSYWRTADGTDNLNKLSEMITQAINKLPNPVPFNSKFDDFFRFMWKTNEIPSVELYGYFQLSCVLQAMKLNEDLNEVLDEVGIVVSKFNDIKLYQEEVSANNAKEVLELCLHNLCSIGINISNVKLELTDNPEIQCASFI